MSGMDVENRATEILKGFSAVNIKDKVPRGVWVLYRDGPTPKGITRGQWMDTHSNIPTTQQFTNNSFAIHASLTNNDKLKVNGKFGEYDYMPPQVFVNSIQLSESQQKIVHSTKDPGGDPDKTKSLQNSKAFGFRAAEFRKIADEIGVPRDIPKFLEKLKEAAQIYETIGGGGQPCHDKYDNQTRAGNNIPNLQVWKDKELVEVAWHTKDGKGKYDVKSLDGAIAIAEKHGEGAEIALKANTNRIMGITQLEQISAGGADRRWAAQIGQGREQNTHFSALTVVLGNKNVDFKWLATQAPGDELVKQILNGNCSETLRVIGSGNGRTSVQFAMAKFPKKTKELLAGCGIPESIADVRDNDLANIKKAGAELPAVSVPDKTLPYDGPPTKGVDVMKDFEPHQIMIANRNKSGDLTGAQRTLGEYETQKLELPDDAAKELGLEPNVYSKGKTANLYENRTPGRQAASAADW